MDFFLSVRGRAGDGYSNRIGAPKYLAVPRDEGRLRRRQEISRAAWFRNVQDAAGATETAKGHVIVFVHGFNIDQWDMLERHRKIRDGMAKQGYKGAIVSFDWPSDGSVFGYNADRRDARRSADLLFVYGIKPFSRMQTPDCAVNLHVLAHSMGCFLVREAFDYADDDHETAQHSWTVSQVAFAAADVSSKSMASNNPNSRSLFRHSTRLTNYYSPFDEVLSVSEVKRIGVSRRLGRVGLPDDVSEKAVNLYCGEYFRRNRDDFGPGPQGTHSWYFDAPRFYEDLNYTFTSNLDRNVIPTRTVTDRGNLALI